MASGLWNIQRVFRRTLKASNKFWDDLGNVSFQLLFCILKYARTWYKIHERGKMVWTCFSEHYFSCMSQPKKESSLSVVQYRRSAPNFRDSGFSKIVSPFPKMRPRSKVWTRKCEIMQNLSLPPNFTNIFAYMIEKALFVSVGNVNRELLSFWDFSRRRGKHFLES